MNTPKPKAPEGMGLSLVIYLVLATIAFFPCLFLGQAYFDNDLLAQFGPWRAFLKDQLSQDHFPLWNPYLMGGQPFFADLQNMMLYPFNWLTLPFSVPTGLSVFFFIHMVWAALGMHLWLKTLGLSKNACRVGALLFSLSGFFWLEIIHPPVLAAFAWLPWLFGRLERLAGEPRRFNAFLAGLCFAMLFLCGSFQVTVGAFYGSLVYFLFRYFQRGLKPSLSALRTLLLFLFLLWGALPLLGQLIPTMEFAALSNRNVPASQLEKSNQQLSLERSSLGQFLFPRISLNPGQDMAEALQSGKDTDPFPFAADWGYLGPWALLLALLAFRGKQKSETWFFGGFTLFSLLFCFGRHLPLHGFLSSLLPGLGLIRVPYRFLYFYVLPLCALSALGFEQWNSRDKTRTLLPALFSWVYASALFVTALFLPSSSWREIAGLVLGAAALFLNEVPWPRLRQAAPSVLLAALAVPLFLNGWADFETGPASNFDFRENSRSIPRIAAEVRPFRMIFGNNMLYPIQVGGRKYALNYPQNAAVVFSMKNFGGYNPLALQAKKDLARIPLPTAVDLGALQGLLTLDGNLSLPGFTRESFPPFYFYRWKKNLAYAFAPGRIEIIPGSEERLKRLEDPGFKASLEVLLSEALPADVPALPHPGPAPLQCRLDLDEADQQSFSVVLGRENLVVFADVLYPGWKAWVDGRPSPLFTADHILRCLWLPAGQHKVEFKFEPVWWTPIRIGLALWLAITLAALGILFRRNFFALLQKIYYSIGGHGLGRIKPLRWAYDALFKLLRPESVMVQGHRMWLDDKDTLQLAVNGIYEPVETSLLKEHLKAGQTFIDVGANIGYYTLLAARITGAQGKVYAFEPDPDNFKLLLRNIAANGYANVVPMNQALSNKAGTAKLYINPNNRGDHRIYDSHDGRASVEVGMTTLDQFFKKLDKKVHFIKMDIQGAEAAALGGMKGLIQRNKGLKLVTEFSPGALKAFGADPKKYLGALQALGFRFLEISEKTRSVKPVTPAQLLKRPWGGGEDYTNLFCIKK